MTDGESWVHLKGLPITKRMDWENDNDNLKQKITQKCLSFLDALASLAFKLSVTE